MNGWLSPTAEFFPCAIGNHQEKARELIAKGNAETWVAIYHSGAFSELPLTEAQIKWLVNSLEHVKDECYADMVEFLLEKQVDYVDHAN